LRLLLILAALILSICIPQRSVNVQQIICAIVLHLWIVHALWQFTSLDVIWCYLFRACIFLSNTVISIIFTLTLLWSEEFSFIVAFESSAIAIVGLNHHIHFVNFSYMSLYEFIWPLNVAIPPPTVISRLALERQDVSPTNLFMLRE